MQAWCESLGTVGTYIWGNSFSIPITTLTGSKTWGVYTKGATLFKITENTFDRNGTGASYPNYGVIINNSVLGAAGPPYNCYFHKNSGISNVERGAQFEINNTTIQAFCNTHSNNTIYDWDVCPQYYATNAMDQQGQPFAAGTMRANNNFDACGSSINQIRSSVSFSYYDYLGNADVTSTCISNPVAVTHYTSGDICNSLSHKSLNNKISAKGDFESGTDPDLVNVIHAIMSSGNDTSFISNLYSVVDVLEKDSALAATELLIPTLLFLKNYITANDYLYSFPDSTKNLEDFKEYYGILLNAGENKRSIFDLSDDDFNSIKEIADGDSSIVSSCAQAFLMITGKASYKFIPQEDSKENSIDKNEHNPIVNPPNLVVSPNPSSGDFTVQYGVSYLSKVQLIVLNINGTIVMKLDLSQPVGTVSILGKLSNGIYYTFLRGKEGVSTGQKIIISK